MAIPKIQELYDPVLGYLSENGMKSLVEIRHAMMEYFYVSEEEAFFKENKKKRYSLFEGRVNTACSNMYHAGLLKHPKKGYYDIADKGIETVEADDDVNKYYLWEFPEYIEYVRKKNKKRKASTSSVATPSKGAEGTGDEPIIIDRPLRQVEYKVIEEITLETAIKIKKQNTMVANMMAAGMLMLADGQICEVPTVVMQHDMSYAEFRDTASSNGVSSPSTVAFECKTPVSGNGPTKASRNRQPIPGGTGIKRPRKWNNPDPFTKTTIQNAVSHADEYKKITHIMDAMNKLINQDFNISYSELMRRTGISDDKLRNMCVDRKYNPKFSDLAAIFITLKVTPLICKRIFGLAGFDVSTPKYERAFEIIELGMHYSIKEINDMCRAEGVDTFFPATLE